VTFVISSINKDKVSYNKNVTTCVCSRHAKAFILYMSLALFEVIASPMPEAETGIVTSESECYVVRRT